MAEVTVHPGGVITGHDGDKNVWSFSVTIDGQLGIVEASAPSDWSEAKTRAGLQIWLEKHPNSDVDFGGVASTGSPGDQGETTSAGDDNNDDNNDDDNNDDDNNDDDNNDDDDDGKSGGDEDKSDDEGDGVGDRSRDAGIVAAIMRGLASGVLTWSSEGDDDTGPTYAEQLGALIAKVTSREVVIPGHDIGDGLGDDTGDSNHERLAALLARALARGGLIGPPDDGGDGDGTGRPFPTIGHVELGALDRR